MALSYSAKSFFAGDLCAHPKEAFDPAHDAETSTSSTESTLHGVPFREMEAVLGYKGGIAGSALQIFEKK